MHLIWYQKPKAQVIEKSFNMQIKGGGVISPSLSFGCTVFIVFILESSDFIWIFQLETLMM